MTALLLKITGLQAAWDLFNGKKSYIAGTGLILAGAAQILARLAAAQTPIDVLHLAENAANEPGTQLIMQGLGVVGIRHAISKSSSAPNGTP